MEELFISEQLNYLVNHILIVDMAFLLLIIAAFIVTALLNLFGMLANNF